MSGIRLSRVIRPVEYVIMGAAGALNLSKVAGPVNEQGAKEPRLTGDGGCYRTRPIRARGQYRKNALARSALRGTNPYTWES